MPTTTTFPACKAALASLMDAATAVQVARRWPGPTTEAEGIYLGDVRGRMDIDSVKEGRKYRIEEYTVEVICQAYRAALTPTDAAAADLRAGELFAVLENVCANDTTLGGVVRWAYPETFATELVVFERGLAVRLTAGVAVTAYLT